MAHAMTAHARGTENQLTNGFRSAATFYDQNAGQWANANKLKPTAFGANACKIAIAWDEMTPNHRNGAKRMKQSHEGVGDPKFKASAKAMQAMAEWAACFAPRAVKRQESGTEVEARVMQCSRSSPNAVAAKAAMRATPTETAKERRQMPLHAKDGNACEVRFPGGLDASGGGVACICKRTTTRVAHHGKLHEVKKQNEACTNQPDWVGPISA